MLKNAVNPFFLVNLEVGVLFKVNPTLRLRFFYAAANGGFLGGCEPVFLSDFSFQLIRGIISQYLNIHAYGSYVLKTAGQGMRR